MDIPLKYSIKMQETQFENAEFRCFFRLQFRPHQWEHHRVADIPRAEQNLQNAVNAHAPNTEERQNTRFRAFSSLCTLCGLVFAPALC